MVLKAMQGRVWNVLERDGVTFTAVAKHGRVTLIQQERTAARSVTVPLDLVQELVDGIDALGKGDEVRS